MFAFYALSDASDLAARHRMVVFGFSQRAKQRPEVPLMLTSGRAGMPSKRMTACDRQISRNSIRAAKAAIGNSNSFTVLEGMQRRRASVQSHSPREICKIGLKSRYFEAFRGSSPARCSRQIQANQQNAGIAAAGAWKTGAMEQVKEFLESTARKKFAFKSAEACGRVMLV